MQRIRSKELRDIFRNRFKKTLKKRNIWILDTDFVVPKYENIVFDLISYDTELLKPEIPGISDCDKRAKSCVDHMVKTWHKKVVDGKIDEKDHYPRPFGFVSGLEIRGIIGVHAVCIFYCDRGVFLSDPIDVRVWEADERNDKVFYLDM